MSVTLTPKVLADLRGKAEVGGNGGHLYAVYLGAARPETILVLLDRIEALEGIVRDFMEDPHAYTPKTVDKAKAAGF